MQVVRNEIEGKISRVIKFYAKRAWHFAIIWTLGKRY
jgi:hypothetical protein